MNEKSYDEETISEKVIGVNEDDNAIETPLPENVPLILSSGHKNGFDVVNEWEVIKGQRVKGKMRTIGEYVAEQNLIKKYPTAKEIRTRLSVRKEYCKKLLSKARKIGLLLVQEKRSGHQYRYFVSNIKEYVVENNSESNTNDETELNPEKDPMFQLDFLNDMICRENMSFHHINIKSKLRDNNDYSRLNWNIESQENKGKVFELKISRYRSCKIIVYPGGTVSMILKCTSDPFYLGLVDDMTNFLSLCGEILNVIKAETINSEPLATEVADWKITQFDGAFDVPIEQNGPEMENKRLDKGFISWKNFGSIRVKYLGQLYQLYSKNILHKGKVFRIEKRFSFAISKPTINSLKSNLDKISK